MLRSLAAVLVAVLMGLTLAKFLEGALAASFDIAAPALSSVDPTENAKSRISSGYALVLGTSWLIGAFSSALFALWIGRRWAPLGWLAGVTVSFNGLVVLLGALAPIWLWLLLFVVGPAGAWGAIKLLRAKNTLQQNTDKAGYFE
ncbi:MAG: hypothetical protein EVA70_03385 [Parvularculaceae bacterium]|nr:MAG: hypothetical protein EVA70_03385 [Parvularculaceae bacterium]